METEVCLSSGSRTNELLIIDEMIDDKHLIAIKQKNSGASAARNIAIDYAWNTTDIYGILDADDEYYPSKVRLCVDKMLDNIENIGVVYTDYDIEYTGANFTKTEFKEPYNGLRLKQSCIVHSGSLINKRALAQIKENGEYYDTNLHGPGSQGFIGCSEDYDLWLRIAEKFMIVHLPTPLALARETGRNQTANVTEESEQRTRQIIANKITARQQRKT
jgi:glycosyltransferase involved in cell wall biosynthesis